jgi:hypothetical protein
MQPGNSYIAAQPTPTGGRGHAALAVLLLAGALLPGCGGTGERRTVSHVQRTDVSHEQHLTRTAGETRRDIIAAVAACKRGVDLGTWLPKSSKAQLYTSCARGLKRGLTELRVYGLEVCSEVAFTSPAKNSAERARIFASCYAGTKEKTAMIG